MFNQPISSPVQPLTPNFVNKLTRIQNEPDYALISLAIAVMKPRIGSFSGIEGTYWYCNDANHIKTKIQTYNQERSNLRRDTAQSLPAFYYLIASMNDDGLASIREGAKEMGLTELTAVELFVKQQLNVSLYGVFISPENNAAFVAVSASSMALYHLSLSFVSLLYPEVFKHHPLTRDEAAILQALTNKTYTNFIERTSVVLSYMKTDILHQELIECFKGFRQTRINLCQQEIGNLDTKIETALQQYRNLMDQREEQIIRYEGLMAVNGDERNKDEQEAIEYLSTCPRIHDISYNGGTLSFCADTLFTNFSLDKWQNAVRRNNIYDNYRLPVDSIFHKRVNREMLFNAIFSSRPKLQVRVKGYVELKLIQCDMIAPRGQDPAETNLSLKDFITNPHFKIHGCPGRNKQQIITCLRRADIISAIECSIAAVGSVNIDETEYTFRPFLQEILTSKNKVLENSDGDYLTPEEAILWLSKREAPMEHASPAWVEMPF